MFSRILVQPFKVNPFQKMKVENGLIIDTGGYTPHTQLNEQTGRYEEQKQFIVTGCVVEVGPEVKYLKEGDVIFYRIDTAVPVPFFKQGFVSLAESQIIAVVNEGLQDRFNNIKSLVLNTASCNSPLVVNQRHLIPIRIGRLSSLFESCLNKDVSFFTTIILGLLGISYLSYTI